MGPVLTPWTLLSGILLWSNIHTAELNFFALLAAAKFQIYYIFNPQFYVSVVHVTFVNKNIEPAAEYINGLVQDCGKSIVLAMELLWSCTKLSIS